MPWTGKELTKQTRRGFISGLISLIAAPAIVRASSLMPVKAIISDPNADKAMVQFFGAGSKCLGKIYVPYSLQVFSDDEQWNPMLDMAAYRAEKQALKISAGDTMEIAVSYPNALDR